MKPSPHVFVVADFVSERHGIGWYHLVMRPLFTLHRNCPVTLTIVAIVTIVAIAIAIVSFGGVAHFVVDGSGDGAEGMEGTEGAAWRCFPSSEEGTGFSGGR